MAGPLLLLAFTLSATPLQSHACLDCHVANGGEPWPQHQSDWDVSAHARARVTCEKCHGGDPTAFDVTLAHAGVLRSSDPASPTHRARLAATCGRCHAGPAAAFEKSRHQELLRGTGQAPSCASCHGAVAAQRPASAVLAAACDGCHGAGEVSPRPGFADRARRLLEDVQATRAELAAAARRIDRIGDPARRRRLQEACEEARGPLTQAVHSAHGFVFDELEAQLAAAKQRSQRLQAELAEPPR